MKNHFYATCRFCKVSEFDHTKLVKYGVRHYAHHACYLDRKPLRELHNWQVANFPWKLIVDRGLEREATALMRR